MSTSLTGLAGLAVLALALAACNDDGRTLRPATPEQNASVSTLAPPTTVDPALVDGGIGSFDTLAVEPTVAPTLDSTATTIAGQTPSDGSSDVALVTDAAGNDPADPSNSADLPAGSGGDVGGDEAVLTGPFAQDAPIDQRYTCDDDNSSPPLTWSLAPKGTIEVAISMTDTDAPGFIHWVMAGLDPSRTSLTEAEVPVDAIVGKNSTGGNGYYGPCPPVGGAAHHYVFTVHFLAQQTELSTGAEAADLLAAIDGATFNGASLVGTYART